MSSLNKVEVKPLPPTIEGTYMSESHYYCSKCHEMLGFPHPDGLLGIWHWVRVGEEHLIDGLHPKFSLERIKVHLCFGGEVK